jgi:hypothetical protein
VATISPTPKDFKANVFTPSSSPPLNYNPLLKKTEIKGVIDNRLPGTAAGGLFANSGAGLAPLSGTSFNGLGQTRSIVNDDNNYVSYACFCGACGVCMRGTRPLRPHQRGRVCVRALSAVGWQGAGAAHPARRRTHKAQQLCACQPAPRRHRQHVRRRHHPWLCADVSAVTACACRRPCHPAWVHAHRSSRRA